MLVSLSICNSILLLLYVENSEDVPYVYEYMSNNSQ